MTPDLARQMGAWRHSLHRKPELGFQERGTAAFITAQLEALGFIVHGGIGGTGLVASLRSGDGAGVIGLRADMDALTMTETGTSAHASGTPGACTGAVTMSTWLWCSGRRPADGAAGFQRNGPLYFPARGGAWPGGEGHDGRRAF